jgi:hypothetical protein
VRSPILTVVLPILAGILAFPWPARAQVQVQDGPLPAEVQARALEILNDPGTLRLPGGARIPAGTRVDGDVAVLSGSVMVGGEISGLLLVVNGDLTFLPGAVVGGQVLVVGGVVEGGDQARLLGEAVAYRAPLRYRIRGGRVQGIPEEGLTPGFLESDFGFGRARVTLRAASNYNRIEGLPVQFGPIIETRGRNPLRLEAFGTWRSVSGLELDSDDMGYRFRLEQAAGGRGEIFLGATAHREIVPVEDRGMSTLEASLSTFFLRRDLRDYYQREGWEAYAAFRPARLPLQATLSYRHEDHASALVQSPWTLRSSSGRPWREQFLAASGPFRAVEGEVLWDSRDDPYLPSDGWWARAFLQRQVGGSLAPDPFSDAMEADRLTTGSLDLRRYARVSPDMRLLLRGVVSGSVDDTPLPAQFQGSLGGEGSLPGHPRFSVDCGARERFVDEAGGGPGPGYLFYGCDRTALFQAELQGRLPFAWNPVPPGWEQWEWAALLDLQPRWALLLNAGRGWVAGDPPDGSPRIESPTRADVGLGLFVGPLGLYWAYPLNRRDQGVNFFIRLQQRF